MPQLLPPLSSLPLDVMTKAGRFKRNCVSSKLQGLLLTSEMGLGPGYMLHTFKKDSSGDSGKDSIMCSPSTTFLRFTREGEAWVALT